MAYFIAQEEMCMSSDDSSDEYFIYYSQPTGVGLVKVTHFQSAK